VQHVEEGEAKDEARGGFTSRREVNASGLLDAGLLLVGEGHAVNVSSILSFPEIGNN
jgi:hypothetical protein